MYCHRIFKLQNKIDEERVKLSRDKGASSLRNNSRFKLYVKSTGHNFVQRIRKISQNSSPYEKHYDEESVDGEECSKSTHDTFENVMPSTDKTFRRISISKRKRRGKNSIAGFTKLHDLEEVNEEENDEIEMLRKTSLEIPSTMSLRQEERVHDLDEDLAVLEEKGYYMESDIEEEDLEDKESAQNSAGSDADYEDSSSDTD